MIGASPAKLGTALMKPPSRTHCTTPWSRSPTAAWTCASTLSAQSRAAATPCWGETSAPSLPL